MHSTIQRLAAAFSIIALTAALVSCGGGGGGSDSVVGTADGLTTADKGAVTLLVTDAPTDDFKEINMTVLKAELLCDSGNQELFSGVKELDLLELTDVTEIFSISEVTAGFCSKIRLKLEQVELVFKESGKPSVLAKLLGNGKLDLKPKSDFYVGPYDPLYIQLDFDAEKSIHIKGKEDYNFRPVVFIKIVEDEFDTKLVRQRGTVENLNDYSEEFDLCLIDAEVQPVSHEDDDFSDCVRVNTKDAPASIFDDQANPISFRELEKGDIATVVGRFSFFDSNSDDDSSDGKLSGKKPKGDKSHDDKSHDDKSSDDKSSDDDSSDDDSSDDRDRPALVLVGEVIWTGNDIVQTTNIACSGVTTDTEVGTWYKNYELPIPDGGVVCVTPGATRTILQPGAKIYDSEGNGLDDSSIAEDILNNVDAYAGSVEKPIDPKAVLVMLALNEPLNPLDQLTGTIKNLNIDFANETSNLELITMDVGDRCVHFDNVETEVFETSLDDGNIDFDQKSVFSLRDGQKADVFGTENNGCLDAEIIIYEQEAEIDPV